MGVDQGDRGQLSQIATDEFGTEGGIDLVVDDASHDLELTIASFEVLFPLVRPGGSYVIEDWTWQLQMAARALDLIEHPSPENEAALAHLRSLTDIGAPGQVWSDVDTFVQRRGFDGAIRPPGPDAGAEQPSLPLAHLIQVLTLCVATTDQMVASMRIGPGWVEVVRGPASIDPRTFSVESLYNDWYGLLRRRA